MQVSTVAVTNAIRASTKVLIFLHAKHGNSKPATQLHNKYKYTTNINEFIYLCNLQAISPTEF